MSSTGMVDEYSPLNDSPLCAECNLPITDGSYILWKGIERVCHKCRNDRMERLRKVRQKEIKATKEKRPLNLSALKTAASATTIQLKAREKWGLQRIYLEATFSDVARTQRIRYLFASDIPIYIPSRSRRHMLYLRNIEEVDPFQEAEK